MDPGNDIAISGIHGCSLHLSRFPDRMRETNMFVVVSLIVVAVFIYFSLFAVAFSISLSVSRMPHLNFLARICRFTDDGGLLSMYSDFHFPYMQGGDVGFYTRNVSISGVRSCAATL